MAKLCRRCGGLGFLHKPGEDDFFCFSCPRAKPAVMRKWKRGARCILDKATSLSIKGLLVKPPFRNPSDIWMVVISIVENAMKKDGTYGPRKFNVMVPRERVRLK